MPTFLNIYLSADNKRKTQMIKDITSGCDISDSTFQTKKTRLMAGDINAFTKLEREHIAQYMGKPVKSLFPEPKKELSKFR